MKLLVLAYSIGLSLLLVAQIPKVQGDAPSQLVTLERQWIHALEKRDLTILDSVLLDSYIDTDEEGHRTDKRAVLSAVQSGRLKIDSIDLSDVEVWQYDESAVMTGNALQVGTYEGVPLAFKVVFTNTFVRRNGRWQAAASHRSGQRM